MTRSSKAVISALHSYTKCRGFDVRRVRIFVRNGNLPRTQTLTNESWDLVHWNSSVISMWRTDNITDSSDVAASVFHLIVSFKSEWLQIEIFVTFNFGLECCRPKNFSLVNVVYFSNWLKKLTGALLLFLFKNLRRQGFFKRVSIFKQTLEVIS